MAEKKFAGLNGSLESPELSADYDSAAVFERLRVGVLNFVLEFFYQRFFVFGKSIDTDKKEESA